MYKIDKSTNSIRPLEQKSFSSLGFTEVDNLQEWIASQPDVLGENLLIIQKEFDGFDNTKERLDLLALDKEGALVIIENKLDDSGKDVTWQALKYASYCSELTKADIADIYQRYLDKTKQKANAEERISDFMDGKDFEEIVLNSVPQRIILIAAKFRKEVTSAVLWLMNYKVQIKCFRATPFAMNEELFLNVEQVIPTQDAEDYMIGLAEKADDIESQTELKNHLINERKEFWAKLLQAMNEKSTLFQNINPGEAHWIAKWSGARGVRFQFEVTKSCGRAELYIDCGDKKENEIVFDQLHSKKEQIEDAFGGLLVWERLEKKQACRIKTETPGNVLDRNQWEEMISFMTDAMTSLGKAFREPLDKLENN